MTLIQFTKGKTIALCLSQAAVMAAVVFFFPQVHIETFTCQPHIANGTVVPDSATGLQLVQFPLSLPFILLSCLGALFSTTTTGLIEQGIFNGDSLYSQEVLYEVGGWDLLFWLYCAGAHALVILLVMSPVDAYAACLSFVLIVYFLCRICQPRNSSQISMTQENVNLMGICLSILLVAYNIPDSHTGRTTAVFIMCLLDYLLGAGHTWDVSPNMDVVTNCRLFWVCSVSFCMAALYGAWHDHLLVEVR
jgi:hypothetical protein